MEATEGTERRQACREAGDRRVVRIEVKDGMGHPRWVTADLIDISESGAGILLARVVEPGVVVVFRGKIAPDADELHVRARVVWCTEESGKFRVGLEFIDASSGFAHQQPASQPTELDCYEVMQLSPNADADTVHRVYRILAQRHHPDNRTSGNSDSFMQLTEAYRILGDPERRAGYDARYRQDKQLQWSIFEKPQSGVGAEGERRKRAGILDLLYNKLLLDCEHPTMNIQEFETMLGCPREHLQTAIWYLRGKGHIQRSDNGRYTITVEGVDEAESRNAAPGPGPARLLPGRNSPSVA